MSLDRIMPTGRIAFDAAKLGTEVHRALSEAGDFRIVVAGTDFSIVEQHILACMVHESRGGHPVPAGTLFMDLETPGGELPGPFDLLQRMMDDMRDLPRTLAETMVGRAVNDLRKPNLKQNGRSADYLKHGGHYGNASKRPR